jgi:hypothetical protein
MRVLLKIALSIIAASILTPLAIAEPANTAAAMEFVRRQHLGSNLKVLAFATAQRTQTFAMLASKIGMSEARGLVSNELDNHAHQFQGKWNENLAKAYAQNFTPEELASLASEGRNSKYIRKLSEKQVAVGESMQRMSTPILTAYVTAAMTSAMTVSWKKK